MARVFGLFERGRGRAAAHDEQGAGVVESAEDVDLVRATLSLGGVPWEDLEDGLQQVRLKLLETEKRRTVNEQEAIRNRKAWLSVVSSRVAVDWHRREARDRRLQNRLTDDLRNYWRAAPSAAELEERHLASIFVAESLETLPPLQRQVLVLRYWADMTVPEIAVSLRVPQGTVKSRLHAATISLRDVLRSVPELQVGNTGMTAGTKDASGWDSGKD